jgi:hypothetical protein
MSPKSRDVLQGYLYNILSLYGVNIGLSIAIKVPTAFIFTFSDFLVDLTKSDIPFNSREGLQTTHSSSTSAFTSSPTTNPCQDQTFETTVTLNTIHFLKNNNEKDGIIWKGASMADISLFHSLGGEWDREIHERHGGDLSVAPSIYYSNKKRYALAWAAYKIPPTRWQSNVLNGSIIFEAQLDPTTLDQIDLPDSEETQMVTSPRFFLDCLF